MKNVLREDAGVLIIAVIALLAGGFSYFQSRPSNQAVRQRETEILKNVRGFCDLPSADRDDKLGAYVTSKLTESDTNNYTENIWHHTSLAFLISVIVIFAVELPNRKIARKDLHGHIDKVGKNVWEALGGRLVGPLIARELDSAIRADVAIEDSTYEFTFKIPEAMPEGFVIVQTENSYKLRNLGCERVKHWVRSNMLGYEPAGEFPRFRELRIRDIGIDLADLIDSGNRGLLKKEVELAGDPAARTAIKLTQEVCYHVRDTETFVTRTPIERLRIQIQNQAPDRVGSITVGVMHPSYERLEHPTANSWYFPAALLPGQGFYLAWKPHEPSGSAGASSLTRSD